MTEFHEPEPDSKDDTAERVNHAQEVLAALGPMWQPHPAHIEWLGMSSATGEKIIVMVVADPTGRRGISFTPDALEKTLADAATIIDKGRKVAAPLTIAKAMPQGMPMPGVDPFRAKN